MTIDPMNAPILGDCAPSDPPRPVRLAVTLLMSNLALAAGYRVYTAIVFDDTLAVMLIPFLGMVALVLAVRAGHGWARATCTLLACLGVGVVAWLATGAVVAGPDGVVALVVLVASGLSLIVAVRLMWRPDAEGYFSSGVPDRGRAGQPSRRSG